MTNLHPNQPADSNRGPANHEAPAVPTDQGQSDLANRSRQAAWRFSARMKNNTAAWIMWAAAPFVVGVPIHDFYLGAIGRGLIKIALVVIGWGSFMAAYFGFIFTMVAAGEQSQDLPAPGPLLWVGFGLALVCMLVLFAWWVYDAFKMSTRIDSRNDAIRKDAAQEFNVDPWSF